MAPKAKKKFKGMSAEVDGLGLLAGKTAGLLPAPLVLPVRRPSKPAATAGDSDEDDGPPEEAVSVRVAAEKPEEDDGPPEEAISVRVAADMPQEVSSESPAKAARRRKKDALAADDEMVQRPAADAAAKAPEYFWQDPANREALGALREQSSKKRRVGNKAKHEKEGITLVRLGSAPVAGLMQATGGSAKDFLMQEMFGRRKRQRSITDRKDRNVVSRIGSHRVIDKIGAPPLIEVKEKKKTMRYR